MKATRTIFWLGLVFLCIVAFFLGSSLFGFFPLQRLLTRSWETHLFAQNKTETACIKLARFDVDFIASFSQEAPSNKSVKHFLALYPFIVEAELDLEQIEKIIVGNDLVLYLPNLEITSHFKSEDAQILIETLELDYNTHLRPVLEMFLLKSRDYALLNAQFMNYAREQAEQYIETIFGLSHVEWKNENFTGKSNSPATKLAGGTRLEMPSLPLLLETANAPLIEIKKPHSQRDALELTSTVYDPVIQGHFRIGSTHTKRLHSTAEKNPIVFSFSSPMNPSMHRFISNASEGYTSAFVFAKGLEHNLYIETIIKVPTHSLQADIQAKELLYLAASILPDTKKLSSLEQNLEFKTYQNYVYWYEKALEEARCKRFGKIFAHSIEELHRISYEQIGEASQEALLLQSLEYKVLTETSSVARQTLTTASQSEKSFKSQELIALLEHSDFFRIDPLFRNSTELLFIEDTEISQNIAAFFYLEKERLGLSEKEAEQYKIDLIQSGIALSKDILEQLSVQERNSLYTHFVQAHTKHSPLYICTPEDNDQETWTFLGPASIAWKEKHGFFTIRKKLLARINEPGKKQDHIEKLDSFVLVYGNPIETPKLFSQYNALILTQENVSFYKGINEFFVTPPLKCSLSELVCIQGEAFLGAKRISKQKEIVTILSELYAAYSQKPYNKERAISLLEQNIDNEIVEILSRP